MDPVAKLVQMEVQLAKMARGLSEKALTAPPEGAPDATIWCDYGFKWPAYAFAHLYHTAHPDNPFHRADWCADLAMKLVDKSVSDWHYTRDQGNSISTREVPHYVTAALLDWIPDLIDNERRSLWTAHSETWAAQAMDRPFGFTGTYHDAWRLISLFRLGQAFDHAEWRDMAVHFFRQMIQYQTPEGFWEEARHHGPSMRYNGLMLPPLAWIYRLTGDKAFADSARRLASFMATYTYPDAITVGPFDGRNSPMMAFFPACAGMELCPEGRVLAARAFQLWEDLGAPENMHWTVESTRDAVRLAFYVADSCTYLADHVPADEQTRAVDTTGALEIDTNGTIENHSAAFDGMLCRNGPWVLALSGQNSDVSRITRNVYRLERQSRIELWHEKARLVLGGGHSLREAPLPYANVVLETEFGGKVTFGRLDFGEQENLGKAGQSVQGGGAAKGPGDDRPNYNRYQSNFIPQLATTERHGDTPRLTLVFAHGTVQFDFNLADNGSCRIRATWDVRRLSSLCLQIPVVVWDGAQIRLDGCDIADGDSSAHDLKRILALQGGPFDSTCELEIPEDTPCKVHFPLLGQPSHTRFFDDDPFQPPYRLALVSCQWRDPPDTGAAEFTVHVES